MTAQEYATQLRVGIFMGIGLLAIALMVVYFGRFGERIREYYKITVQYPNASGIYEGANVLLAGAKVGSVESDPAILPTLEGVSVELKIYKEVSIPEEAQISIGSSGLLGDRFVQIMVPKEAKSSPALQPGAVVKGKGEAGINEMIGGAEALLSEIQEAVGNINKLAQKLNTEVFKETTISNLDSALSNLKQTTSTLAEASKNIDKVLKKAEGAVETGQQTFTSAKETFTSAKGAADELKKTIGDVRSLVQQARHGRGALAALLSDREMADNLKALVANLRRHGVLWYKDRSAPRRSAE
jgi:phospholipid/cholesterol/gamma-HCH transport system substrate-binding protein